MRPAQVAINLEDVKAISVGHNNQLVITLVNDQLIQVCEGMAIEIDEENLIIS